jgi:Putative DNA-binding domain
MNSLAKQQAEFVAALQGTAASNLPENMQWLDQQSAGLAVYQNNARMLSPQALAVAFPVLQMMLGEDNFVGLARLLWREHPPHCGDLGQWGADLPQFIAHGAAAQQLADEPYLADVARVEWALHQCARAADATTEPQSLALLMQHEPHHLRLSLCPAWALIESSYPVVSLVNAHAPDATEHELQMAGQSLREGVAETALVYRQGFRPQVRQALPGEAVFLNKLAAGADLSTALDATLNADALDFSAWLPLAVQTGLLLGVVLLN